MSQFGRNALASHDHFHQMSLELFLSQLLNILNNTVTASAVLEIQSGGADQWFPQNDLGFYRCHREKKH